MTDFVETVFLPWADKNKEASTARSYKNYWNAYLKPHFNHSKTLKDYAAYQGTALLEKLAAEYSANTLNHIRALASTIFKHATAKGYIKQNPWRDVVLTAEGQEVKETVAHNQEEVETVIDALERVQGREEFSAKTAAMAIAVGYGLGLRPSEISEGCAGENVDLHKNRVKFVYAFVAGSVKGTKTNKRRILNMDPSLLNRMKLWASGQGYPTSGWVFPAQRGDNPINMTALSARVIKI